LHIVLATRNRKKVEELVRIFAGSDIFFQNLDDFPGSPEVIEDGSTFRQNAVKKAVVIARYTGCPAIADDSGLEVAALGGSPGVYSARYAGKDASDRKNVKKVLKEMRGIHDFKMRAARFVCCIAIALPDGRHKTFTGYARGTIGKRAKGNNGFGYDPIFIPHGDTRTFAEMSDSEKDALSHRGKAMKKLFSYLKHLL
jgi:XTP/dITP diphosphohydrolase